MSAPDERFSLTSRFYATLKNLQEFHDVELKTAIVEIPIDERADDRQKCVIATYYRMRANVESMLTLKYPRDVQAVAMLARSLFELAVDLRLLDRIEQAPARMMLFSEAERLRSARKLTDFKRRRPESGLNVEPQLQFVTQRGDDIDARRRELWPDRKKVSQLKHWSTLNLEQRAEAVGSPFPDLYQRSHTLLSWYVHAGLMGIVNLPKETFTTIAGEAFLVAVDAYENALDFMIRAFPIRFDPRYLALLAYAKRVAWTDDGEQAWQLRRELGIE